jgi:hypothetical protein
MLTKAGYRPAAIFAQALAGSAVLALVADAMIPIAWKKAAHWWCSRRLPAFCLRSI